MQLLYGLVPLCRCNACTERAHTFVFAPFWLRLRTSCFLVTARRRSDGWRIGRPAGHRSPAVSPLPPSPSFFGHLVFRMCVCGTHSIRRTLTDKTRVINETLVGALPLWGCYAVWWADVWVGVGAGFGVHLWVSLSVSVWFGSAEGWAGHVLCVRRVVLVKPRYEGSLSIYVCTVLFLPVSQSVSQSPCLPAVLASGSRGWHLPISLSLPTAVFSVCLSLNSSLALHSLLCSRQRTSSHTHAHAGER